MIKWEKQGDEFIATAGNIKIGKYSWFHASGRPFSKWSICLYEINPNGYDEEYELRELDKFVDEGSIRKIIENHFLNDINGPGFLFYIIDHGNGDIRPLEESESFDYDTGHVEGWACGIGLCSFAGIKFNGSGQLRVRRRGTADDVHLRSRDMELKLLKNKLREYAAEYRERLISDIGDEVLAAAKKDQLLRNERFRIRREQWERQQELENRNKTLKSKLMDLFN